MTPPIQIEIVPSFRLTCLAVLFHLGAVIAVIAGLPTGASIYLCFVALVSLSGVLVILRLKHGEALISLTIDSKGKVRWVARNGQEGLAGVAREAYVSSSLVILRLLPRDASLAKTRIVLLAGDSAPSESLAKLRVWLKWRPVEPAPSANAED